jgi:cytochrome c-type biogenesis protein
VIAMQYLLVFLEGVGTFVSPCMLPMLPIYIAYFSAGSGRRKALSNALGFVLGFTLVFMAMGAAAGTIGQFLSTHKRPIMQVAGVLSILLGLIYAGLIPAPIARLLKGFSLQSHRLQGLNFFSSVLFGIIFSVGWTPCVGVFLSAALLMAAGVGHTLTGVLMLLCFSLGLGIPFVMAALLLERLTDTFAFLKRHLSTIHRIGGAFLVLVGIAMVGGWLDRLLVSLL